MNNTKEMTAFQQSNALAVKELELLRRVCGLNKEIDQKLLEELDERVQRLVIDTFNTATENSIDMILSPTRTVPMDGVPVNGYFRAGDSVPWELVCAIGQPTEKWIEVFVHESCHMDQFLENTEVWADTMITPTIEAGDVMQLWIDGVVELTEAQKENIIGRARDVELDCERRTVEKIKAYNLPINVDEYTQKANAYILFYNVIKKTRAWYVEDKEPYNLEAVWRNMPTNFDIDYKKPPVWLMEVFYKEYNVPSYYDWGVVV